jgi:hypothetical protein
MVITLVIFNFIFALVSLCQKFFFQENLVFSSKLISDFNCSAVSLPNISLLQKPP